MNNQHVFASYWSNKQAVKMSVRLLLRKVYLTPKDCKFHKYSIINFMDMQSCGLQDAELERIVKLNVPFKKSI